LYDAALRDFRSGRLGAAEAHCRKSLAAEPNHADTLHLLGLIYAATNRIDPGVELIAQAIRNNPANPEYFSNLGTLLQRQGKIDEAFKSYDIALKLKPDFAVVWIKLGDLLFSQKRIDEALLTYDHAFSLDSLNPEAARKSGLLLVELQRYDEALVRFDLVRKLAPDRADALYHAGFCLSALKQPAQAIPLFQQSLSIDPRQESVHNSLGVALLDLYRSEEALAHFDAAIDIDPGFTSALGNRGIALTNLRRLDEALAVFDRAIAQSPASAEILNNKANAFKALGRCDEALECYDRAIALKPDYVDALNNRGSCLDMMLRADEALASFRVALAVSPDYPAAHWNIAVNRLRVGDFRTGWIESEWRWKCGALRLGNREFGRPLWFGQQPIDGKTVLLHSDQGLGDALHFCRYAPLVAARGARVVLEINPPLRELVSDLAGVSKIIAKGEALPDFDYHCPLGSLPLAFDTSLETIPSDVPYILAPEAPDDWPAKLGPAQRPRIGLVWSGNPDHANDHNRSIALELLLPLFDAGAQFVSLQKELRASDAALLRQRSDVFDAGPELESFSDTARLLSHLDLVISVDTSVAHLAGALGRPVWVLLPRAPDWRWLLDREDSPWYPTMRLFRQSETAEWPSVIQRVKAALQAMAGTR
jgi:tetratricopeptide (TPR) repeat protein